MSHTEENQALNAAHSWIRDVVGAAKIIVLLALAYSAVSYVSTYSKSIEPSSFRSFTVQGEGKIVAIPDIARFTFSVITQGGTDIAALQQQNTAKVNGAIEFVKSKGVEAKDIKTEHFGLDPRYQTYNCPRHLIETGDAEPCPPPTIVGYTVEQTVSVKVRDFAKIGELLSGVVSRGANSVSQLSFTIDDPTALENEARAKAITQAKEKAESVARAGGFKLGRILSIQEGGVVPVYRAFESKALGFGGGIASLPVPAIEPGSQEVTVVVSINYEIR